LDKHIFEVKLYIITVYLKLLAQLKLLIMLPY